MQRIHQVLLVALASASIGTAIYSTLRRPSSSRELAVSPTSGALRFDAGLVRAYAFTSKTAVASVASGGSELVTELSGRLNVRMLAGKPGEMAVQLSPLDVRLAGQRNDLMSKALSRPFVVQVGADGEFGETRCLDDVSPGDCTVLDSVLRALQVVVVTGNSERWSKEERDPNGSYVASYRRLADGVVEKTKERYLPAEPGVASSIAVLSSEVRASIDGSGPWLAALTGRERVRLGASTSKALAEVDSTVTLHALEEPPLQDLELWRSDLGVASKKLASSDSKASASASAWDQASRELERNRFREARVDLPGLLDALSRGGANDVALAQEFVSYLRAFPAEARKVKDSLRGLGDLESGALLSVLASAGTPEAQGVLTEVAESGAEPKKTRLRAAIALGSLEMPEPETVTAITRLSNASGDGTGELASVAKLTLGALAGRADGSLRDGIVRTLMTGLTASSEHASQRLHLRALENGNVAVPFEELQRYTRSSDETVREAAISLAPKARDAARAAEAEVGTVLANDRSPRVRNAAAEAALVLPPTPSLNDALRRALAQSDLDTNLRARMAQYLAHNSANYPGNAELLEEKLRTETSREVVLAILNSRFNRSGAR